tara:strand:+ start:3938 stop:4636 length:699 start_codon:yes stop_codon:yes gene_type:complete
MTTTATKKTPAKKSQTKATQTIVTYIREARSLIGPILKEADANMGRGGSYSYTSTEAMLGHCRDIMTDLGLVLTPEKVKVADGCLINEQRYPIIETVWRLDCDSTGEHRMYERDFFMENLRTPLKGECSVMTTQWLYMLRDVLMLPRLDQSQMQADSDPDGERTARDRESRPRDAGITSSQTQELMKLNETHPAACILALEMCKKKYDCGFEDLSSKAAAGVIDWIKGNQGG